MRVERAGASSGVAGTRRASPASGGGNFATAISRAGAASAPEATGPTGAVGALAGLDALVALQSVDGDRASRRRARERGATLLDALDSLRIGLLDGRLTASQLDHLTRLVASQRGLTDDPQLNAVLDEIDLRAQVELAKFQSRR